MNRNPAYQDPSVLVHNATYLECPNRPPPYHLQPPTPPPQYTPTTPRHHDSHVYMNSAADGQVSGEHIYDDVKDPHQCCPKEPAVGSQKSPPYYVNVFS